MRIASPIMALIDPSPETLANRLLDEIEAGHLPVWPTTARYADKLVTGLRTVKDTRRATVVAAIDRAPVDVALDWPDILSPLTL